MSGIDRERAGQAITAAAGAVLLVSLFLTWSSRGRGNFLVLFGALNRLGGFFRNTSQNAWQVYSVADIALAAVAVSLLIAVMLRRAVALIVAGSAAVAALVFTIIQLFDPPVVAPPAPLPAPMAAFIARAGLTSGSIGAGEVVATIALIAALGGLVLVGSRTN